MTKQQTSSDCKNENAAGGLHEVSAEDCEPVNEENSDQEREPDSQSTVKPTGEIDDGGPLSI